MPRPPRLTHADVEGRLRMVDVGGKAVTAREAVASGHVALSAATRRAVRAGRWTKGDPLQTAHLAGVMAAKRTSDLIPLCHPLVLTGIDVELTHTPRGIGIRAAVRTEGQTGVEMEALTAVSVAALTVYDMLKAIDQRMVIEDVRLEEKRGGRSGHYRRAARPVRSRAR
jgi:cyclic pyranopterin monophosphate synthase